MSLRRLRPGEAAAATGALLLLLSLFLRWFRVELPDRTAEFDLEGATGWGSLGWVTLAFVVLACALAAWMVGATLARAVGPAVMATVFTAVAATFALALLVLRLVLDQPDLGAQLPGDAVAVRLPAYLGLLGALLLTGGAWWAMRDERTDSADSAYTPPPPRPAPAPEPGEAPAPPPRDPV